LNPARSVSGLPSVFSVGEFQLIVTLPVLVVGGAMPLAPEPVPPLDVPVDVPAAVPLDVL